jgi:hypothetical protein
MSDADAATTEAAARAQSYRDSLESLRTRTDTAAKVLVALGTAGLTAVGIEKVTDVFPYPDNGAPFVALALLGFLGMVAVIVVFTVRLYRASEALKTSSDPNQMVTDPEELEQVNEIYDRMADLNSVPDLPAYERLARQLQTQADGITDETGRNALYAQSARIRAEVRATQASAAHTIISGRLQRALSDRKTKLLGVSFVAALLAFGLAVDWLDSERTAEAAALKGCADAIKANVPADSLPEFCGAATPKALEPKTPDQQAADRLASLAVLYGTCVDTAVQEKQPLTTCDSIKAQLRAAAN